VSYRQARLQTAPTREDSRTWGGGLSPANLTRGQAVRGTGPRTTGNREVGNQLP